MNLDLSIHRMAVRETDSLVVAQAIVAKKRSEIELQMVLTKVQEGGGTSGADLERALGNMQQRSDMFVKEIGHTVDKTV